MAADAPYYEYIVVGCGGIGSATLYWLSKYAKSSILGLEQFQLGHDHGGSQDHSRIIWAAVEKESGIQLVHKHGSLDVARRGTPGLDKLEQCAQAMDQQNIPYERLSSAELMSRYPYWRVSENTEALFQSEGGLVDAALGNSVHIQLAKANGAEVIEECAVIRLQPTEDNRCLVHTTKGTFFCRRVIITAGAWINQVLGSVNVQVPVTVTQEQVTYIATPNVKQFTKEKCPVFIYHTPSGFDVYGMPSHVNSYFKIGIDAGGNEVLPGTRTYVPDPIREKYCLEFCKEFLPKAVGSIKYSKTCLYTMTRDRNFVIDSLSSKGLPHIIICCGAGHAYKFASFLGKVLSELAISGKTEYNIDSFRFQREAVQKKNFKREFWRGDMTTARL